MLSNLLFLLTTGDVQRLHVIGKEFVERLNYIDPLIKVIILANLTICSFWQIASGLDSLKQIQIYRKLMYDHFTASYDGVFNRGLYHTLLTSTFSHMNILHLGFNMTALMSYSSVAKHLGPAKFLYLYLGGGLVSSLCQVMHEHVSSNRSSQSTSLPIYRSLGASGAISAIQAWFIFRVPNVIADVVIYGQVVKMKFIEYGALLFFVDVIGMIADISIPLTFDQLLLGVINPSTIGYAAHIGGAVYGAVLSFFKL
jgi:membrane associated rhomboid family serine protease